MVFRVREQIREEMDDWWREKATWKYQREFITKISFPWINGQHCHYCQSVDIGALSWIVLRCKHFMWVLLTQNRSSPWKCHVHIGDKQDIGISPPLNLGKVKLIFCFFCIWMAYFFTLAWLPCVTSHDGHAGKGKLLQFCNAHQDQDMPLWYDLRGNLGIAF